ncbi:hypothetical protein GOBAR_DD20253 [Gossypium barbadense]|nr:hypothetical protein GOBAR_DD20253 [Gossypium barbadense]
MKVRKGRVATSNTVSKSKAPSCKIKIRRRRAITSNTVSKSTAPNCKIKIRRQRIATSNTVSENIAPSCKIKVCRQRVTTSNTVSESKAPSCKIKVRSSQNKGKNSIKKTNQNQNYYYLFKKEKYKIIIQMHYHLHADPDQQKQHPQQLGKQWEPKMLWDVCYLKVVRISSYFQWILSTCSLHLLIIFSSLVKCLIVTIFSSTFAVIRLTFFVASSTPHSSTFVSIIARRSVRTSCCSFIILLSSFTLLYSLCTLSSSAHVLTSSLSRTSTNLRLRAPNSNNRWCGDDEKSSTASTGTLLTTRTTEEFSQVGGKGVLLIKMLKDIKHRDLTALAAIKKVHHGKAPGGNQKLAESNTIVIEEATEKKIQREVEACLQDMQQKKNEKLVSKVGKMDFPYDHSPLHLIRHGGTSIGLFSHNDWSWTSRDDLNDQRPTYDQRKIIHISVARCARPMPGFMHGPRGILDVCKDSLRKKPARVARVSLTGMRSREESSHKPCRDEVASYARKRDRKPCKGSPFMTGRCEVR